MFLRGIRERAGDTWYPYRHHLIEAKQSDETNKREGMRAPSLPFLRCLSPLVHLAIASASSSSSRFHLSRSSRIYLLGSLRTKRSSFFPSLPSPVSIPFIQNLRHLRPRSSYSDLGRSNTCANSLRTEAGQMDDGKPKEWERRDNHMVRVNLGNNQGGREKGPIWRRISYEKWKKDRVS